MNTIEVKLIKDGATDAKGLKIYEPVVRLSVTTEDGYGTDFQFPISTFEQMLDDWRDVANGRGRDIEVISCLTLDDLGLGAN